MSTMHLSFSSIAPLHSNVANVVSPIGEISGIGRTFERDPAVFSTTGSTDVILYNFYSTNDQGVTTLSSALASRQIQIANWLYQQALGGIITDSSVDTLNLLKATFTDSIEFDTVGEMVTNNSIYLPSIVKGSHLVSSTVNGETVVDKQAFNLWFSDPYFRTQYPHATYTIIHPVDILDIDTLYELNYQQLAVRLVQETPDVIQSRTDTLHPYPPTSTTVLKFAIYDLINTPNSVLGYWHVLTDGNYNEDGAIDAIQKEILANSKYNETQWGEKIPDLFNPNEFYLIPRYDRLGLLNKTSNTSTLSPIVDYETELTFVNVYLTPNMTTDHVIKSTQSLPSLYKSYQSTVTAKLNNRSGYVKIYDNFTDYQLIPSDDSDFGLMSLDTRNFIKTVESLLAAAESITELSLPPAGVGLVQRFGKWYATAKTSNIKVMVLLRSEMVKDGLVS